MSGALAPQLKVAHQRRIKEHHRLGRERAVLGGAKGQYVDACPPGEIPGMAVQKCNRVGEARTVDVYFESVAVGRFAQRLQLWRAVDRAKLGCLSPVTALPAAH